ncbi:MAG: PTS sugar transporter subunit IIA [Spirochaetota bacterium]|nr:MAG: PTS sugar transporter subunit IIA [Spirochaetota bacterium]
MDIFEALKEEACSVTLTAKNKQECLSKIARLISVTVKEKSYEELLQALEFREQQGSTGLEKGIAIPHTRIKGLSSFVLGIAVSKRGVDFKALDGKKSRLFFIIVGPEERSQEYLKLLAQVSRVAKNKNAVKEMLEAGNPTVLREVFLRHITGELPKKKEKEKNKLLFIVLYERRFLDDIVQLFLERGIRGASVMDSVGISDVLSKVPLFGDFLNFLGEHKDMSKTIMTIVPENDVQPLIEGIEDIMGDLDTHSGALIFTLDISSMKGSIETL